MRALLSRSLCTFLIAAGITLGSSCHPSPPTEVSIGRYLVTTLPIDVGLGPQVPLCVGLDPGDPQGVWWWQPGATGCSSRLTGPTVFRAEQGVVASLADGFSFMVSFALGTKSLTRPVLDVRLIIESGHLMSLSRDAHVALERRHEIDVPEKIPRFGSTLGTSGCDLSRTEPL